MPNARGNEARLLARRQPAFGTAESAADGLFHSLPFYRYNVVPSGELANDDANYGDAFPGELVAGLRNLGGAVEVPLGLNSIGWHLAQLFGDPDTTGTGPYTHVFAAAAQPAIRLATHGISHMGVASHFTQDSLAMTGMEIQAQKNGQRQRVTFNLAGREEVKAPATLDATPVLYSPDPVPVGFQGAVLMEGAAVAGITQAGLTLNSGVEADQTTLNGLATAADMDPGFWDLSGQITARFRGPTLYDRASDGTSFALQLTWTVGAALELAITVPAVRLERTGVPVEGRDIITSSFNWRAGRPAPGADLVTVTLKNDTPDYAPLV